RWRLRRHRPHARDVQEQVRRRRQVTDTGLPLWIHGAYLVASILFIVGLKQLSSPKTARRGNRTAALGLAFAVLGTLFIPSLHLPAALVLALGIGLVAGFVPARRVAITDMPQMVAALNGLGGGAAAIVALAEFAREYGGGASVVERAVRSMTGGGQPP